MMMMALVRSSARRASPMRFDLRVCFSASRELRDAAGARAPGETGTKARAGGDHGQKIRTPCRGGWVGPGTDLEIAGCTTPPEIENRARISGLQPDFESRRLY